uniref:Wu:fj29h11 n=1 Tax=Scleropages formosus TaxID=113540 RepID=A0A8C9SPC0_SCLFO
MLRTYPEGLELGKLRKKYKALYGHSLNLPKYGLKGLQELLEALGDLVYVEHVDNKNMVKVTNQGNWQHTGNPSSDYSMRRTDKICNCTVCFSPDFGGGISALYSLRSCHFSMFQELYVIVPGMPLSVLLFSVIDLLKECPDGIPLKALAAAYNKKYKRNLSVSDLGFRSMASFVLSLQDELHVQKEVVFHKACKTHPVQGVSANKDGAGAGLASPVCHPSSSVHPNLHAYRPSVADNKKQKEERSCVVFKDAYHAQLREVHSANVRAVEAREDRVRRKRGLPDVMEVNSRAEEFIRHIAAQGEHVTREKVISKLCEFYQVQSLNPIDERQDLPALSDFLRLMREVNMFLAFEAVSAVCTLYELGLALAGLKNKKRFEELNLGPLCKIPRIHRMFKVDSSMRDEDIRTIETVDILRSLRVFRKRFSRQKVDLAEFLKYLADQYNCESPYELGIRIQGLGLPISTLQKAINTEHSMMDKARATIQKEIEEEVADRMKKIKKTLLDPTYAAVPFSSAGSLELRKKYVSQTAAEAVLAVFNNAEGVFNARMTKHVKDFLLRVSGDRLATALFQLAICCGSLEVPQDLVAKEKPCKPSKQAKNEEEHSILPPSEAAIKQYFQERLETSSGGLTLPIMSKLEKKLVDNFQVKEFTQMKQGTFLEFLVKHNQILQEAGGRSIALSSQENAACGFRPSRQDIFEFIKQCGSEDQDRSVEQALRSHYKIQDSRELGYGQLSALVDKVRWQKGLSNNADWSPVRYESHVFLFLSRAGLVEAVGLLGQVTVEQAVSSLLSAPLLEDLAEWSQWELVFQEQHGLLKHFIEKQSGRNLAALEVRPGVLLRITPSTGDRFFAEAAAALDPVSTAGHLVSIAVADGITNSPVALLANHMESSLAAAVTQEGGKAGDTDSFQTVAKFVLDCMLRIPTRIGKALLPQVFLEPLARVLGQAKSKAALLQAAKSDLRYQNRLHHVGLLLGVTEWQKDFHGRMSLPQLRPIPSLIKKVCECFALLLNDCTEDTEEKFELASAHSGKTHSSSENLEDTDHGVDTEESAMNRQDSTDPAEDKEESKLCQYKAVIESIRKSEFGIGVELNEEVQQLMKVHQERLGRSLDRLSAELYSKDTHFVLELIQNADDNSYPGGDVQPALTFVVEKDCITILNNERGFEEKNIRAICDVGRSTKGKHKYGYIGQKGIGFKSVFKVTDCPEIHSNGFHIRFDKNSSPMGYILPHWVDEEKPLDTNVAELRKQSWTTKIFLPLRSESYQAKNLFHDVDPSLLLFLHRLRSITIFNQMEGRLVSMARRDLSHNVLEVRHTNGVERWLVVRRRLFPKKAKDGVESTELALAFRLNEACEGVFQPEKQPVFAFLPLRSFGFRFIIQGDFDIPSSREDVDRDSHWNQWLRSEIPQLFLHAMDVFQEHPEFSGLQGLCHFLQFIPLPSEILDFFNPVASQIIQLLKGKACLPTREHGLVEFKLPSQIAISPDPLIQEVIRDDLLHRHLNLSYLHPTVQSSLPPSLVSALGVHRLKGSDISTITRAMAKELVQENGTWSGNKPLASLLVCNFRALEQDYDEADAVLQALRDIPIIPLADGRLVALNSEGVFFPLMDEKNAHSGLEALCKDLSTVSPRLLECLDPLGNSRVLELLKRLDVHELEPQKVLNEHIYPILRSGGWKRKHDDIVISYIVFIKQHSQDQDYRTLDGMIPVMTNKGFLYPKESKVQFSMEYDNIDLCTQLPGVDWVMLHTCYLMSDRDVSGWREFFSILGVRDLLIFKKEKLSMSTKDLSSSLWAQESKLWPQQGGGVYVIEDYQCEELRSLLMTDQLSEQQKLGQRKQLLNLLNSNWVTGENYSQYLKARVVDSQGQQLREAHSSFFHYLTQLPWVPAFQNHPGGADGPSINYLCPSSVHLYSDDLYRLLGHHVTYVPDVSPSEFTISVGMKHTVSVEDLISHLKKWCMRSPDNNCEEDEGAEFTTTVEHVHSVYTYLSDHLNGIHLKKLFQEMPAVFIEYKMDELCSGKFYLLKEVCWNDPTGMFRRYRDQLRQTQQAEPKMLAPFYGSLNSMREFFHQSLNVDPNPSMKQYVDLLELMCSSGLPTGELLQDVFVIFAKLGGSCVLRSFIPHPVLLFSPLCSKVFPTKRNGWVKLAQGPLIPDIKNLEKVFESHEQVCLLNLPAADKKPLSKTSAIHHRPVKFSETDRALFLEICGVKKLSQCVTAEAQTENYRPCPPMQAQVRRLIPYIQRFLYYHEPSTYMELQDSSISQLVKGLSFGQVGKLYIQYQLNLPDQDPVFEKEDVFCLLKDRRELYIQKDHLSDKLEVCRELEKLFSTNNTASKDLERFLSMEGLVLCKQDAASLKRFLNREDIKELPAEEEKWEVPEPMEIKPELPGSLIQEEIICNAYEQDTGPVIEAVMKMWPPPGPPPSTDGDGSLGHRNRDHRDEPPLQREQSQQHQMFKLDTPHSAGMARNVSKGVSQAEQRQFSRPFQGNGSVQRAPMALDSPVWSKELPPHAVMEDLVLDCLRPNTVVFTEDNGDTVQIGQWGEQLVNAFLMHWKDTGGPDAPRDIVWYNCDGEGGQPFDFKVIFATEEAGEYEVFVEVKSTIRSEKHFIHLSANELDLALREKEKYHIYRVYNAGNCERVRLCRIKNLAQHLHSKELELYLFV